MPTPTRRTRAAPMSPEQRRDAIIAATVPLLREYGRDVTTRQIAEAAGIAEGTIFRVFDDKESLLRAAVEAALHSGDTERQLAAIDVDQPLETRLLLAMRILRDRLNSAFQFAVIIGLGRPPGDDGRDDAAHFAGIAAELERLIEPDRGRFRMPPADVAHRIRVLSFAGFHPIIAGPRPMTPDDVVDLLLRGVQAEALPPETPET